MSAAVEEGSFSWIPEYRLWALLTQQSLDITLAGLQVRRCHKCGSITAAIRLSCEELHTYRRAGLFLVFLLLSGALA